MQKVAISHPEKMWWPDEGISKLDVARYYEAVAPRLLPWTADRPLVAERCPDGMLGDCFFQKNFATGLPRDVPRVALEAKSVHKTIRYVVGGSAQTLLSLVNLGCITIHLMNCRRDAIDRPDWLTFDLDPSSGAFADAARAALELRRWLDDAKLRSYVKTSGSRGLHVLVPLREGPDQDAVRAFARDVGESLSRRLPALATMAMSKRAREGRVFVDTLRNAFGQTVAAPYSVRRRPHAPISAPLDWDEVDPKLDPSRFNLRTIERRLAERDPWTDFWKARQSLPRRVA